MNPSLRSREKQTKEQVPNNVASDYFGLAKLVLQYQGKPESLLLTYSIYHHIKSYQIYGLLFFDPT